MIAMLPLLVASRPQCLSCSMKSGDKVIILDCLVFMRSRLLKPMILVRIILPKIVLPRCHRRDIMDHDHLCQLTEISCSKIMILIVLFASDKQTVKAASIFRPCHYE